MVRVKVTAPSVLLCPLLAVHFRSSDKNLKKKIVKMHHQNEVRELHIEKFIYRLLPKKKIIYLYR